MLSHIKLASLVGLAALTLAWAPAIALADDTQAKVSPAVLQLSGDNNATVQPVRWGVSVGGGGWGGGWSGRNGGVWIGNGGWNGGYSGYYGGYGGYYQPYYGGYYYNSYPGYYNSYPYYGGYYYAPNYYYYSW